MTCAAVGASCGPLADGCGGTLDCGACEFPATCGIGGANKCGCTPTTCAAEDAHCGSITDGCGGVLVCGSCNHRKVCIGGLGPANCSEEGQTCRPTTGARVGAKC